MCLEDKMENEEIQLRFPATLTKTALTPDELKGLITSKVDSVLLNSDDFNIRTKRRINARRDNVIKRSSLSVTRKGNLDRRRAATETIQNAGITPAATSQSQNFPGPSRTMDETLHQGLTNTASDNYIEYLSDGEKACQDTLFRNLLSDEKLDQNLRIPGGGVLQRNGRNLTAVELCNELDRVATLYAAESVNAIQEQRPIRQERNTQLKPIIDSCFRVTLMRISLMSLHGDDILSVNDYDKWKKHVYLIASFATLTIALGLFFDQSIELLIQTNPNSRNSNCSIA